MSNYIRDQILISMIEFKFLNDIYPNAVQMIPILYN